MMKAFLSAVVLFAILANVQSSTEDKATGLIVGGRDARPGKYPHQILIFKRQRRFKYFLCGGSILNNNWILTAAHCLSDDNDVTKYEIAVGKHEMDVDESYTQYSDVAEMALHENYNERTLVDDIALMRLDTELVYGDFVQPVNLADEGEAPSGRKCFASGFGVVNERTENIADTLQELKTKVVGKKKCKKEAAKYGAADDITDEVVCTKDRKKGVCSGDSGGPLGCFDGNGDYTQYGVLSWGSTKCRQGFNVYTRVSQYRGWIADNM